MRRKVRREARMRVGFDPYDESPIKRRGESYLEHELHDGEAGYEPASPEASVHYDYEGYPTGRASSPYSRSGTPTVASSTPISDSRARSSVNTLGASRQSLASMSSPSPLLRRATAQPGGLAGLKQPTFSRPPTAPHPSGVHRQGQAGPGAQSYRGSVAPDTPPSSVARPN